MLEDFSLDIYCIMLKTYAYIQCTKIDTRYMGSNFLAYESNFISGIQKVSARKLEILKEMKFNAYIDKDSKEYRQCVSIVYNYLLFVRYWRGAMAILACYFRGTGVLLTPLSIKGTGVVWGRFHFFIVYYREERQLSGIRINVSNQNYTTLKYRKQLH